MIYGQCNKELYFENFRKIKPLANAQKSKYIGWTDVNGGKRYNTCRKCEQKRSKNEYNKSPIPQMLSNSKIIALKRGIPHTINGAYLEKIWSKENICPVLGSRFEMGCKYYKVRI